MKTLFPFLLCIALILPTTSKAQAPVAGIVGRWKTIDDKTEKPKSIVEISQQGDEIIGTIRELLSPKEPNPVCKECKGDKKDKPILGLQIISGMKEVEAGKEWGHGEILDPENGKTYSCKLKLQDDGKKLEVRGFIGFSLLGRSQLWERAN